MSSNDDPFITYTLEKLLEQLRKPDIGKVDTEKALRFLIKEIQELRIRIADLERLNTVPAQTRHSKNWCC